MNMKLKAKIFEKFATQHDFSRTAGVHESHVSRVVQGRRTLTESERQEWARPPGDRQHGTLGKGCFQCLS